MKYDNTGRESGLYLQIRGSLKIVCTYMEQIKALGKYDDATIIITADPGQRTDFKEETGKPQRVLSPVIMIREPHQTDHSCRLVMCPSHRLRCWHVWSERWGWIVGDVWDINNWEGEMLQE